MLILLLRSVNGIMALNPFLAAMLLKMWISSSRLELRKLKSVNAIVSTSESRSIRNWPEVAYFIEA